MLDGKDKARIKFQRINEDTGKEVPYERIVRAFDLERCDMVLDDRDLESSAVEKGGMITVHDLV